MPGFDAQGLERRVVLSGEHFELARGLGFNVGHDPAFSAAAARGVAASGLASATGRRASAREGRSGMLDSP